MAHHGSTPFDRNPGNLARDLGLGATNQFPQGKLTPEDEGEIRIAIGQKDGKVVVDFGKPIAWVGFDPEQAESFADTIRDHARECRLRR